MTVVPKGPWGVVLWLKNRNNKGATHAELYETLADLIKEANAQVSQGNRLHPANYLGWEFAAIPGQSRGQHQWSQAAHPRRGRTVAGAYWETIKEERFVRVVAEVRRPGLINLFPFDNGLLDLLPALVSSMDFAPSPADPACSAMQAALVSDPLDLDTRLVYSDWVEEHVRDTILREAILRRERAAVQFCQAVRSIP